MVRKQLIGALFLAIAMSVTGAGCKFRLPWESQETPAPQAAAATASKQPEPRIQVPETKRLANVNQQPITLTDLETAIQELKQLSKAYNQEWKTLSSDDDPNALDLNDILNNLVILELKAQDAQARGLDRKQDVQQRWAYLQRNFLAQEWDRSKQDTVAPSDDEIQKTYEQYKLGFLDPERIEVRQIVTASLADAEGVRARAVQGAVFQQLAAEVSLGEGKERGGDAGWYLREIDKNRLSAMGMSPTENVFFPQLEPVAFALEKDQISQPVKGPDGRYYVLQLVERKPARQRTEVEVHDQIKASLAVQKVQEQIELLKKKADIKTFPDRLSTVEQ